MLVTYELSNTTPGHAAEPVEIWKTRKFIEEHSGEELSLSRAAKAVNIHPNYLSERFKLVTGMKFVEYVARTRFERACGLLQDGNVRISEIAFAVGFQSLSQFNRVFKKFSGKSPTQYRKAESVASDTRRSYAQLPFSVVRPVRAPRIAKSPSAPQESHSKVTKSLPAVRKT
jgi:AraC-like DNA-binding protein